MAQQLKPGSSRPASNIYTLLIAVAAIALGAALVMTYMNMHDFYGLKAGNMLEPLSKVVTAAATK